MLESVLLGGGFAFAAAAQPGPLQAFFLSQVAGRGWKHTLPAALSPLLSDGPIAAVTLVALGRLPRASVPVLQTAGGLLLLYLGWSAFRSTRGPARSSDQERSAPRTLAQAAAVNLLNPNPYLGWSLVLGPATLSAWQRSPAQAVSLLLAFYLTMIVALAATIVLFGTTRLLGPRGRDLLVLVSAGALAALGVFQLVAGLLAWHALR